MAKWDDPIGQIKAGAEKPPKNPGTEIAERMVGWMPVIGKAIGRALDSIKGQENDARIDFLLNAIVEQLEAHEEDIDKIRERTDQPEFNRLVSVAIERMFFGANERKVRRFAAIIANAATTDRTEQEYEDAASFIRALDELSEDDVKVLKHLYNHQKHRVNEQHAMPPQEFYQGREMQNMLADARNLGMQMDDFYARSNRLIGYGLALSLTKGRGGEDPNDAPFRMTLLGKRLMEMLANAGETTQVTKSLA
ncbi:MAG: hypothetical protein AABM67_19950 [Acidobacteriota bacterium]